MNFFGFIQVYAPPKSSTSWLMCIKMNRGMNGHLHAVKDEYHLAPDCGPFEVGMPTMILASLNNTIQSVFSNKQSRLLDGHAVRTEF